MHCLLEQLVKALRVNDPDAFKSWLSGGVQDLGEPAVEDLLLDWTIQVLKTKPLKTSSDVINALEVSIDASLFSAWCPTPLWRYASASACVFAGLGSQVAASGRFAG